jgi:hypothetical protein
MSRRKRRARFPVRCDRCLAEVRWFRLDNAWRLFDRRPIDPRTSTTGRRAYPVEAGRAWRLTDLVPELMGRRGVSAQDAEDEAYDMPWHTRHECAVRPTGEETER